jgi:guanylate kinase
MNSTETHKKTSKLFIISGPSGSGKSTICRAVLDQTDAQLSVSATTRPCSKNETDGKDYYFLSESEFEEKIRQDAFLEYARVFDHYYGTPAEPVRKTLAEGKTVVLEIDVQGASQVFDKFPEAIGILILPPENDELRRRLCSRGRDDPETIEKRLAKAQKEIIQARTDGRYQHTIINDDLSQAIETAVALIEKDK